MTLLGGDSALLTDGEPIGSHELFDRLTSKKTLTGEDESEKSELKYLSYLKQIREEDPSLFEKIQYLPKKSRSAKLKPNKANSLLTFFRKGKVQKFFLSGLKNQTSELDFITAAETLETNPDETKKDLPGELF